MRVYRGRLLWEFTMGVYCGSLPLEATAGVYRGSLPWEFSMGVYCGRCIIVCPWLPLVTHSNH